MNHRLLVALASAAVLALAGWLSAPVRYDLDLYAHLLRLASMTVLFVVLLQIALRLRQGAAVGEGEVSEGSKAFRGLLLVLLVLALSGYVYTKFAHFSLWGAAVVSVCLVVCNAGILVWLWYQFRRGDSSAQGMS